jgi:lipoprotein-anchoring transpeptidase ErfK/SrfK
MRRLALLVLAIFAGSLWLLHPTSAQPTATTLDDTYGFLSFWSANDGERLFGKPLTDPLTENDRVVQYFEHARLEYHPESAAVLLGLIGRERTQWRSFPPQPATNSGGLRPDGADYVILTAFRSFWEENGGVAIFGMPISAPHWENMPSGRFQVQYFERALFIHHPLYAGQDKEIELAPLGREIAASRGYIEGAATNLPVLYSFESIALAPEVTEAPQPAPAEEPPAEEPPAPAAVPAKPEPKPEPKPAPKPEPKAEPKPAPAPSGRGKSIEINISTQWLYAYENGVEVFNAPVATGKDGFNTPTGVYKVYAKVPLQTMRGSINGESWVVPDVPHAMYFNGSVALHGTYWHNLFGSGVRISHGCVNLPLDAAAWLYDWAPVGTTVDVHF